MEALPAGAISAALEGPLRQKDPRGLAQREIPGPLSETAAGRSFAVAPLPWWLGGAPVLRPQHAAAQTPETEPGGHAVALRQPHPVQTL